MSRIVSQSDLQSILLSVEKPGRYVGGSRAWFAKNRPISCALSSLSPICTRSGFQTWRSAISTRTWRVRRSAPSCPCTGARSTALSSKIPGAESDRPWNGSSGKCGKSGPARTVRCRSYRRRTTLCCGSIRSCDHPHPAPYEQIRRRRK